ncbi:hypothetical protein [Streptomyces sp. JJ38]|uniref:hypothetical protein n=1 Tax=Streptomyces sp. JJ38 TaxID=2738128 RepID=UPI001C59886C|nr:hypothetical protein [Streptomyces sp. JJ38]MBW1597879.1 hypothetical protein [Streptomyces sp. JJ38]
MASDRRTTIERIGAAEAVAEELREALGSAGVKLPSLRVDLVSVAREVPRPLVDLGRCNQETALALAAVVRKGCGR